MHLVVTLLSGTAMARAASNRSLYFCIPFNGVGAPFAGHMATGFVTRSLGHSVLHSWCTTYKLQYLSRYVCTSVTAYGLSNTLHGIHVCCDCAFALCVRVMPDVSATPVGENPVG